MNRVDSQRRLLQRQLDRDRSHGSPGMKIREAARILRRLLRATATIPAAERSQLILDTEREARSLIVRLDGRAELLRREYFPDDKAVINK